MSRSEQDYRLQKTSFFTIHPHIPLSAPILHLSNSQFHCCREQPRWDKSSWRTREQEADINHWLGFLPKPHQRQATVANLYLHNQKQIVVREQAISITWGWLLEIPRPLKARFLNQTQRRQLRRCLLIMASALTVNPENVFQFLVHLLQFDPRGLDSLGLDLDLVRLTTSLVALSVLGRTTLIGQIRDDSKCIMKNAYVMQDWKILRPINMLIAVSARIRFCVTMWEARGNTREIKGREHVVDRLIIPAVGGLNLIDMTIERGMVDLVAIQPKGVMRMGIEKARTGFRQNSQWAIGDIPQLLQHLRGERLNCETTRRSIMIRLGQQSILLRISQQISMFWSKFLDSG